MISTTSNNPTTSNRTKQGVVWAAIDKFGIVLLQFIINLVLARLLTPNDFGLVGMIIIFITVSQVLIDGGFSTALIQRINPSQVDYSTIFYWNILFSTILYWAIYLLAPSIATFLNLDQLAELLRVLGIIIVINAFSFVQRTVLRKSLDFKRIAIVDIVAYSTSSCIAIWMAHNNYGAWSLVGMQLTTALISVVLFWITSKWRPLCAFSFTSLKGLFSYGGYMLISNIMQDICTHIQGIVIGHKFSARQTGLYTQAKKMDEVASMTLPTVFCQVLFPLYSEQQDNKGALCSMLRKNTQTIAFIIFPLMTLLIIVAEPVFELLYGNQWNDAVPYFQVLCIGGFFSAVYNFNYYAVAAVGQSKALFYWGCYKWGINLILLLAGASVSMQGVLTAMVISNINIYLTNAFLSQRYVGYKVGRQIIDILPLLCCTLLTGAIIFLLYTGLGLHWFLASILFATVYLIICSICKISAIDEVISITKNFIKRF